jgi:hypothetical protein
MDLDVEYQRQGQPPVAFRVLVLPGNEKTMTRLCTNLPRTPFSLALVARLYRFRWQIELLSKEWKSYANLHKFDTANQHIAAGLIWASSARRSSSGSCPTLPSLSVASRSPRVGSRCAPAISSTRS